MKKLILTAFAACLTVLPAMSQDAEWSRDLKDFASTPKVGGYVIGKYAYTSKDGEKSDNSFSQRLVRLYVDGSILTDFKYRVQVQINNDKFHMKDYFIEWAHWKEFSVKVGQYKRAFLFENPYNPWNVGFGDYSQITKMFSGMGDYCGEPSSTGGRDQGIQIQGDLLPAADGHRYLHYQLQLMNGQGINTTDKNARKDLIGTIQFQPIQDLYIGAFGWKGDYVLNDSVTVGRDRWAIAAKYEHNSWSARAEYAHSNGKNISEADGWYAAVGVPVNDWFKVYAKYDVYRSKASQKSAKTIYSLAPNFQIHKNLMLQLQYNYVDNKSNSSHWNEFWAEFYVRF